MNIDTAVLTPIQETMRLARRAGSRFAPAAARTAALRVLPVPPISERLIKPFVFLDHAVVAPRTGKPMFGLPPALGHRHTHDRAEWRNLLCGHDRQEWRTFPTGGLEWMRAGNGVWHDGDVLPGETVRLFQLWVALPPSQENVTAGKPVHLARRRSSRRARFASSSAATAAPASDIRAPEGINYFHVQLRAGERWRYAPPAGHNVAWLAIDEGRLTASEPIEAGQLAVFEESDGAPIELQAEETTSFVIGSAIKHPLSTRAGLLLGAYELRRACAGRD